MSILKYKDANGQWQKIGIPAGADMQSSIYDPQNKKQDIFKYVDDKIGEIPTPESDIFYAEYGVTTFAEVKAQYEAGKAVYVKYFYESAGAEVLCPLLMQNDSIIGFIALIGELLLSLLLSSNNEWSFIEVSFATSEALYAQFESHNNDTFAHEDIRQAIASINPVPYTVSATAPSNTSIFWIDTANSNALKFYNGSAWVAVGAVWG